MAPDDPTANWSEPERRLHADVLAGRPTVLGSGDARFGGGWGPERTIRGEVLRRLLTDAGLAPNLVRLRLGGARITGLLDLEASTLNGTLELTGCHADEAINLEQATAQGVYLETCSLAELRAAQLHTVHSLTLRDTSCGRIRLTEAKIDGRLVLRGATVAPAGDVKYALDLAGVSIGAYASFSDLTVAGTTHLTGAHIGGRLSLRGAQLRNRGGQALLALDLEVRETALLDRGFVSEGSVDLTGSVIGGSLELSGGTFEHAGATPALDLARITIKQNMLCQDGFTARGRVLLAGATISGNLMCDGGQFLHPSDTAIDAAGLTVGRDVFLRRAQCEQETDGAAFLAEGKVLLADAVIHGTLDCRGGTVTQTGTGEAALNARGMKVTRDLLLGHGFSAAGKVDLVGSEVGGRVVLSKGAFHNPGGVAISARQLIVRTSLLLTDDFLAHGQVDLSGAFVAGRLVVGGKIYSPGEEALILDRVRTGQDVEFESGLLVEGTLCMRMAQAGAGLTMKSPSLSQGREGLALTLRGTVIEGALTLVSIESLEGRVDLRQARAQTLIDNPKFWPDRNVLLADFIYQSLADIDTLAVDTRIKWLTPPDPDGYSSHTYQQLASVYRAAGRDDRARKVLYAGKKARPVHGWAKVGSKLLRYTVGYGYYPALSLVVLGLAEIAGWIFFSLQHEALRPAAALMSAYGSATEAKVHFQPFLYTLDLLLPVVSLGQRGMWLPQGAASWVVAALTVLGWVLGAVLAYGLGTAFQRRSS